MLRISKMNSTLTGWNDEDFTTIERDFIKDQGVVDESGAGTDFEVVEDTPQAMSVEVKAGVAYVEVTKSGRNWYVRVESNAVETVVISANVSGSTRIDALVLRVSVSTEPDASATNVATLETVEGTPGGGIPSDGDINTALGSDGWIRIANITVANGVGQIFTADISDQRVGLSYGIATSRLETIFKGSGAQLSGVLKSPVDETILPDTTNLRDLGSALKKFKDLYLAGSVFASEFAGDGSALTNLSTSVVKQTMHAYETFADGEVGVLMEVAEEFDTGNDDRSVGATTSDLYVAQGFELPLDWNIGKIRVRAKKINSPTPDLRIMIYADDGSGDPTGPALGTYDIPVEGITTSYKDFYLTFNSAIAAVAETKLHIVVTTSDGSDDSSNYFQLESNATGGYANGECKLSSDGANWSSDAGRDVQFSVYYNAVVLADSNDSERELGADVYVADGAITAGNDGKFITFGLKDGYTFDMFDDPAEATLYTNSETGDIYNVFENINSYWRISFNAEKYTLLSEISFGLYKNGSPTGYTAQIYDVPTDTLQWSETVTGSPETGLKTHYPLVLMTPGTEYYLKLTCQGVNSTGDRYSIRCKSTQYDPPYIGYTGGNDIFRNAQTSTHRFENNYIRPEFTVKARNAITQYQIGRSVFIDTTPGQIAMTGQKIVGKIVSQEAILVGRRLNDTLIKEEELNFLGKGVDLFYRGEGFRVPAPLNAEKVLLRINTTGYRSSLGWQDLILYRNGKNSATYSADQADSSLRDNRFTVIWDDDNYCLDFDFGELYNDDGSGVTVYAYWFE